MLLRICYAISGTYIGDNVLAAGTKRAFRTPTVAATRYCYTAEDQMQ